MPTPEARRGRIGRLYELLAGAETAEFLDELARMAVDQVDAQVSCGLAAYKEGGTVTLASSDDLAADLEHSQDVAGEGPRTEAIATGTAVEVTDAARLGKWPAWRDLAVAQGVRRCLSLPMVAEEETLGAVTLYARTDVPFSVEDGRAAEMFASYATGALMIAIRLAEMAELTSHLETALESRAVIDQAKGIIMAEQHCTADEAFTILRTASQNQNLRLRHLAGQFVARVSGREHR
ncbi:MAG: GAF and ANTAR domain-containing protein [Pseudonocardia sp.]|nr:GAF and ANTAR domain-containing protein [Pseudonocardia sp.]